jgi:hypothetical protein
VALLPPVVRCVSQTLAGLSHTSPRGTQTNDLVVQVVFERAGAGIPTHTVDGAWTEVITVPHDDGTTDGRLSVAMQLAPSDGATSYQAYTSSVGTEVWSHLVVFKDGTFDTTFSNTKSSGGSSTSNAVPNSLAVTGLTTTTAYTILTIAAWHLTASASLTPGAPVNYALVSQLSAAGTGDVASALRRMSPVGATSEDPGAWTDNQTPNGTISATLAIPGTASPTDAVVDSAAPFNDITAAATTDTLAVPASTADVTGVYAVVTQNTATSDQITGITYGGTAMTRQAFAVDSAGEPGAVYVYKLEASIPQGTQNMVTTIATPAGAKRARCITVMANAAVEVHDDGSVTADTANPSVTLATASGFVGVVFAAIHSGHDAPASITAGTGLWLPDDGRDYGSQSDMVVVGEKSGASVVADYVATIEDAAMIALAVGKAIVAAEEIPILVARR